MKQATEDRVSDGVFVVTVVALVVAVLLMCRGVKGDETKDMGSSYRGPVAPFRQTIGTNAVKVLPERGIVNPETFTIGQVYYLGNVAKANQKLYMCVATNSTGTAGTNTPWWATGEASDGTNTWRAFPNGIRRGWVLYNAGTNDLHLGYGYIPTTTNGAVILPGGVSAPVTELLQGPVYLISESADGMVTGVEL